MATNKVTTNVIDMSGNTGGLVWTQGTTAQRPAGVLGDLRLNTTDSKLEFYNGTDWKRLSESAGTPTPDFQADFLVVGGGGSGSGGYQDGSGGIGGAGGGAGGLRTSFGSSSGGGASNESKFNTFLSTSYTVTIGAGGSAPSTPTGFYATGNDGNASVFATITSLPGGRGGSRLGGTGNGGNGTYGSGGANAADSATEDTTNAGTTSQGFASGGTSNSGTTRASSGGGGAGSAGVKATSSSGGNGGNSLSVSITGSAVTYAGGGGGGATTGGSGGTSDMTSGSTGGAAGGNADAGTVNTGAAGGGGGGGTLAGTAGAGGSGVVILRYPNTYTISVGSGLTSSTTTDGSDKITTFTAGSDTVSFS